MIEVRDVRHHYGVRPVLQGVSFRVEGGELAAVMGPNGAGKSSLLAVIAGVHAPVEGEVLINGTRRRGSVEQERAIRKRVVYLPADPWLPHGRTGRSFLLDVGRLYEIDDERLFAHVDLVLDLFHLAELADASIGSYSTGQRKKVALASALVTEAPILVLDEPFAGGLDPSGILALRKVLLALAERPDVTVLLATPVPEIVEGLAHRVLALDRGRVRAYGTPEELKAEAGEVETLQEVLEQLMDPQTMGRVERYLDHARGG